MFIFSNFLQSGGATHPHPTAHCNQVWLEKLVRSGCVHLLVSRLANAVIEVEQEHQGELVVAFDPLSLLSRSSLAASVTFGIWGQCER